MTYLEPVWVRVEDDAQHHPRVPAKHVRAESSLHVKHAHRPVSRARGQQRPRCIHCTVCDRGRVWLEGAEALAGGDVPPLHDKGS